MRSLREALFMLCHSWSSRGRKRARFRQEPVLRLGEVLGECWELKDVSRAVALQDTWP